MGSLFGGLLLGKNGFCAGDVTARGTQRASVTQLLRSLLHAQSEMGLLQGLDFFLDASDVFLAKFSSIHISFS